MIACRHVVKQFGNVAAVDDVTFTVKKGEVVGFVGANGAGKSTTIHMLLGFITPTAGTVQLFGSDVHTHSAHKQHRRLGYAAGDMQLPSGMTARQYFSFLMQQYGDVDDGRFSSLVDRFSPVLDKRIATLSRGNKQKIALIAAFLPSPDVVILDEPTSGLDPIMQEAFLDLIRDEKQRGVTVFMSSHYLNEVADVCSRILLMRRGRIVSDTPADELLRASGKRVHITSGYARITAPRGAEAVQKTKTKDGAVQLAFDWRLEPAKLQQWLAGVKQLQDIEVTEFNLEAAFRGMYDDTELAG